MNCNDNDNDLINTNYTNFSLAICTGILNACVLWISISKLGYINILREENHRLIISYERLNKKYKKLFNNCSCNFKTQNDDENICTGNINSNSYEFNKETMSSIAKSLVSSFEEKYNNDDMMLNKNLQDIRINHPEIDLGLNKVIIEEDEPTNNVYYDDIYTELDVSNVNVIDKHTKPNTDVNTSIDLFTEEDILNAKHDQTTAQKKDDGTWGKFFFKV